MKKIFNKTLGIGIVGLTLLSTSGFIVGTTNNELDSNHNTNDFSTQVAYNTGTVEYNNDFDEIGLTYNPGSHDRGTGSKSHWMQIGGIGTSHNPAAFFVMEAKPTSDDKGVPIAGTTLKSNYIFEVYSRDFWGGPDAYVNISDVTTGSFGGLPAQDWKISTSDLTPGYTYDMKVMAGMCSSNNASLVNACIDSDGFTSYKAYSAYTFGNYARYTLSIAPFKHDYNTTGLVEVKGTLTHNGSNFYWVPKYDVSSSWWGTKIAPDGTFTITHQVARVDDDSKVGNLSIPNTVEYNSSGVLTVVGDLNELNISSAISHNPSTSAYEWNPDYKIVTTIEFLKENAPPNETFTVESIDTIPNNDGIYFATENDVVINNNIFKAIDGVADTIEFIIDKPDYEVGPKMSAPKGTYELVYTINDDSSITWTDTIDYDSISGTIVDDDVTYDPQYDNNQLNVTSLINYDSDSRTYVWKDNYSLNAQMTFTPDDGTTYSTFSKNAMMVVVEEGEKVPTNVVSTNDIEIKMMINDNKVLTMENEYTMNNYIGSDPGTYEYEYTISYNIADFITWTDTVVYNDDGTLDVTHQSAGDNVITFIDDDMIVLYDDIVISVNVTYYTDGNETSPELPSKEATSVLIDGNPGFVELTNGAGSIISDDYLLKNNGMSVWVWVLIGVGSAILIGGISFGIIRVRRT